MDGWNGFITRYGTGYRGHLDRDHESNNPIRVDSELHINFSFVVSSI